MRNRLFAAIAASMLLISCSDDESKEAKDTASGLQDTTSAADAEVDVAAVDAGPLPCPAPPVAKGKVRARPLACDGELPLGAMAHARVGDLVLENSVARFVVRKGPEGEAVVGLVGGNVIDAVRVGPDGKQIGVDGLREWVPIVQMYLVKPDKVEVTKDGSDGAAVVRVSGPLTPFPTVFAFLALSEPEANVVNEYRLLPDSPALEIRTIITPKKGTLDAPLVGDATFWSGSLGLYRPGSGDPDSGLDPPAKALVIGLARMRADPLQVPAAIGFAGSVSTIDAGGIVAFVQPPKAIEAGGKTIVRRLVVGGDGAPSLAAAMAVAGGLSGAELGTVKGEVSGMWSGVEVELLDDKDRPLTRCLPGDSGDFSCPAPTKTAGARAIWVGNGEGQGGGRGQAGSVVKVAVKKGAGATVKLQAPSPARLQVKVTGEGGKGLPFQAVLLPTAGMSTGDRTFIDGDGDATFLLPAGKWQVWLHHGPEWSAHNETVTLEAGTTVNVAAKLKHVVDTTGWIAADTHIHAEHSSDSDIPNRERVLDAVAVGLDYAVATDHDYATDYGPFLKQAGIEGQITVASGVEVSTAKWGHHGVWPVAINRAKSGNGAPQWHEKDAAAMIDELRGGDPKRVHQVNHPRGSQSYFEGIKLDPKTTDKKLLSFDALEVINSKRMDDTEEVLVDWFGILDRGLKPAAMATSDTHSLSAGVGTARTWIWVGKGKDGKGNDRQGVFTAAQADQAIKDGLTVASTGPVMVVELMSGEATVTLGQTLQGGKGDVTAKVTVTAPEWMPLGKLSIFRNGEQVKVVDLGTTAAKDGRQEAIVTHSAAKASKPGWWTAVLRPPEDGKRPPIQKRPVYAISSPVYEAP